MSNPREHFAHYGPTTLDPVQYRKEMPFLSKAEHCGIDRAYQTYRELSEHAPATDPEQALYEDCCELVYRVAHFRNAEAGDFGREDLADQVRGLLARIGSGVPAACG
jgi:hypothetical protein